MAVAAGARPRQDWKDAGGPGGALDSAGCRVALSGGVKPLTFRQRSYRLMLISSCRISSLEVITRELAWKAR